MLFLQGWKCLKIPVRLCKDLKSPMFWDSGSIPILRCWPPNRNRFTAFQSFFLSDQLPLPPKMDSTGKLTFCCACGNNFHRDCRALGFDKFPRRSIFILCYTCTMRVPILTNCAFIQEWARNTGDCLKLFRAILVGFWNNHMF